MPDEKPKYDPDLLALFQSRPTEKKVPTKEDRLKELREQQEKIMASGDITPDDRSLLKKIEKEMTDLQK